MSNHDKEISSAEMTACWRSLEKDLSLDHLSLLMSSKEGQAKATDYQHQQYPAVTRHFCLRARYFYDQAIKLLTSDIHYDALISFGSGFSLLTRVIAETFHQLHPNKSLFIFDSDIENILLARKARLEKLNLSALPNIAFIQQILDVEKAYQNNLSLSSLFPENINNPIFILEGLTYFLTTDCLQWLFQQIKSIYPKAAIIWDYWPDDICERSQFFKTVLEYFKQSLPENVNAFISNNLLDHLTQNYQSQYLELADLEKKYITDKDLHLLLNENDFIPARVITQIRN